MAFGKLYKKFLKNLKKDRKMAHREAGRQARAKKNPPFRSITVFRKSLALIKRRRESLAR